MSSSIKSPDEGGRRKEAALEDLEARRKRYVRRGRRVLLERALANNVATADEVRDGVELPPGVNAKLFGSVPAPLAREGLIRRAGFVKTVRPEAHARPVTLWQLADRQKAERWLSENPDIPDPPDDDGGAMSQAFLFPVSPNTPTSAAATVEVDMED